MGATRRCRSAIFGHVSGRSALSVLVPSRREAVSGEASCRSLRFSCPHALWSRYSSLSQAEFQGDTCISSSQRVGMLVQRPSGGRCFAHRAQKPFSDLKTSVSQR